MQFQVPQNITMEDRIVWFLSPLQFAIAVIGGGISFMVFTSQSLPYPLNYGFGGILGMLTVLLAIGKFNDQPMHHFVKFVLAFLFKPRVRIWRKEEAEVQLVKPAPYQEKNEESLVRKSVSKQDFAQLAAVLDSRGSIGIAPSVTEEKGS